MVLDVTQSAVRLLERLGRKIEKLTLYLGRY